MELNVSVNTAEELRATADYMTRLAQIKDEQKNNWAPTVLFPPNFNRGQAGIIAGGPITAPAPFPADVTYVAPEEEAPAKKTRKKKDQETATSAEEPVDSTASSEQSASASTVTEPAEAPATSAAPSTEAPAPTKKDEMDPRDKARQLIGTKSQEGKRDEAKAVVRSFTADDGSVCNGVSTIQACDLAECIAKLEAL